MMAGKSALHSLCRPLGIVALQSLLQSDSQNWSARRRLNRERALKFSEPMALANAVPLAVLMELGRSD